MISTILNALGLHKVPLLSGLVGATVSLKFFGELCARDKALTFLGGWAAGAYGAVPVCTYLGMKRPELYYGGIGFVLALFSMTVAAAIVTALPAWIGEAKSFLGRGIPGGPKP